MGENAVSELIIIVVEIFVAALVIALIMSYMNTSEAAVNKFNDEQANIAIIDNNLEFEQYNGTKVSGSDVVAAIYHFRNQSGNTSLKRIIWGSTTYSMSGSNSPETQYKDHPEMLTTTYTAEITPGANGMIELIEFK